MNQAQGWIWTRLRDEYDPGSRININLSLSCLRMNLVMETAAPMVKSKLLNPSSRELILWNKLTFRSVWMWREGCRSTCFRSTWGLFQVQSHFFIFHLFIHPVIQEIYILLLSGDIETMNDSTPYSSSRLIIAGFKPGAPAIKLIDKLRLGDWIRSIDGLQVLNE